MHLVHMNQNIEIMLSIRKTSLIASQPKFHIIYLFILIWRSNIQVKEPLGFFFFFSFLCLIP